MASTYDLLLLINTNMSQQYRGKIDKSKGDQNTTAYMYLNLYITSSLKYLKRITAYTSHNTMTNNTR